MEQKDKSSLKIFFASANLLLVLIAIFVLCSFNLARQTVKYLSIKKEINSLEREIKKMEEKNLETTASLEYLNSKFYQEKEARAKFGLQKPDEKVLVILPPPEQEENPVVPKKDAGFNLIKWWRYFVK